MDPLGLPITADLVAQGVGQFLSQGLLGTIVIALVWFITRLQNELKDLRQAHKVEIAEERKLNNELQDDRIQEMKVAFEAISSIKTTLQAFLDALRSKNT